MSDWTPEAGNPPVSTPDEPVGGEPAAAAPSFEPAGPAPLGVVRTPTGHAAVDARLERLADADHLPADGHIEVYEDVHRGLRAGPAAVPGPPGTAAAPGARSAYDNTHDHRS
ncbi:hypothetical protein [Streptomyces sp. MBT61]|uniref:hypothetical protein n=1 Tax=Streptomyces sp. MBT61 TaxID=1488392 RepID=UPI0019093CD6|nr:hypothetical protein [Streptomyces sp. MBT61]MBK3552507.1 hypothetical protein [Streptomyces sp. MBT61]